MVLWSTPGAAAGPIPLATRAPTPRPNPRPRTGPVEAPAARGGRPRPATVAPEARGRGRGRFFGSAPRRAGLRAEPTRGPTSRRPGPWRRWAARARRGPEGRHGGPDRRGRAFPLQTRQCLAAPLSPASPALGVAQSRATSLQDPTDQGQRRRDVSTWSLVTHADFQRGAGVETNVRPKWTPARLATKGAGRGFPN